MTARLRPAGDRAVMIRTGTFNEAATLAGRIRADRWREVEDLMPASKSLLVVVNNAHDLGPVIGRIEELLLSLPIDPTLPTGPIVEIPMRFDGPDLADVAATSGLTVDELAAAHCEKPWYAAFAGFTAGFCYLVGGSARIVAGRLLEPRPSVPAGSVAVAGPYAAIYPRESPGGWQLIGHTSAVLWELGRDQPALLTPGCRVQFVDLGAATSSRRP